MFFGWFVVRYFSCLWDKYIELKFKQWIRSVQPNPQKKLSSALQLLRNLPVLSANASQTMPWWCPIRSIRNTPSHKITTIWSNSTPSMIRWLIKIQQQKARRKSLCQDITKSQAECSCCSASRMFMAFIGKSQGFSTLLSKKYWLNVIIGKGCSNISKWQRFLESRWKVSILVPSY